MLTRNGMCDVRCAYVRGCDGGEVSRCDDSGPTVDCKELSLQCLSKVVTDSTGSDGADVRPWSFEVDTREVIRVKLDLEGTWRV
jgi:hypothetical protein